MRLKRKRVMISLVILLGLMSFCTWARWRPAVRFSDSAPTSSELRVVTWNVGYFAPVSNKNLRDVDTDRVVRVLEKVRADVIVLQELGELEQADLIAEKLGPGWNVYSTKTGHGEQVSAILSRRNFAKTECFCCGGRMTPGVSIENEGGSDLYVMGVHSPHPARGIDENEESIRCVLEHARKRGEDLTIVTGDLNRNFDPESRCELYSEILDEFGDGTIELGETYYAQTRIDHMFHLPRDLRVSQEGSGMVDLPLRWAEVPGFRDHRPIVVTYQLN